jgi:hypothetical protein
MTKKPVHSAFEDDLLILPLASLLPTKQVTDVIRNSPKYKAIASSIEEVGIIEPLVVYRNPDKRCRYLLLDGSLKRTSCSPRGRRKPSACSPPMMRRSRTTSASPGSRLYRSIS